MRTSFRTALAGLALLPALVVAAPAASAASPSPTAGASGTPAPVTKAGTSFLTAINLAAGQDANVSASTGDYLYWAFGASEGQTPTVGLTVNLAPSADRHGPQSWSVEVFDGLRRRQSCTAGTQNATAEPAAASLALSCTLREVRSWAEPWSGDPLPGTYYVRLSVSDVPQPDLGLAASVQLHVAAKGDADNAQPEGGNLKAPLVPPAGGGAATAKAAAPEEPEEHWYTGWFSGWNTRWFWTLAGGALAALAGVAGYTLTRHPRGHRPARYGSVPPQAGAPQPGPYAGSGQP
ncbi:MULTISPECIES: peptidase [unclassified Kitasatospora]|uniref:peptidase n=1 Tax=unclassified Kitasatospora TaxID=2633591 RepID=UPI001AE0247C|nr:peptidase [Kitasatospora sp. RG8]MBP0451426.1 peptidase [Kitasatospora sp. RG8]